MTKFGIPRQSGIVENVVGEVVFEKQYRSPEAVRGLQGFDYIWLIWGFTNPATCPEENYGAQRDAATCRQQALPLTVRPPRLGGNERVGVFASRSPFRPNSLALSSVRLLSVEAGKLIVAGADLMDGTPIYDIKPYAAYSDAHPKARSGFARPEMKFLEVVFPEELLRKVSEEKRQPLIGVLEQDPRAAYEKKPGYVYGMKFASYDVRFQVRGDVLQVVDVVCSEEQHIK